MTTYGLLLAGGSSHRMRGIDKTWLELHGKPVIAWSIEAFEACAAIDAIVVAARRDTVTRIHDLAAQRRYSKIRAVVEGGAERQDSAWAGLRAIAQFGDCSVVAIHDAARCCITSGLIARAVDAARVHGAAVACARTKDTIKIVGDGGLVEATPLRHYVWVAQTPQAIRFDLAMKAFEAAYKDGFYGTDDVQLVERLGERVVIVESDYENIKITTPEDIALALEILRSRAGAQCE